ncbi:MAG: ABC transporter permease [Anaerolineales bacterium]|nr:ABC transporter permease [Chloroflexota bacterium]MBL6982434.1 ABC transporter permease [Anaerolineales bacterium]
MDLAFTTWEYAIGHLDELRQATTDHLILVTISLVISVVICIPLGVWTSRSWRKSKAIINAVNGLRVIPSLAILFLLVPYMGVGLDTAIIALTILAMPPILVNTDAAFRTINPAIKEAAAGMGMTKKQILRKIEFPLALPIILTGIRTASTEVIASATLAAFIGSGGLGLYIQRGYAMYQLSILFVGAIPIALLVLASEALLSSLQRAVQSYKSV